MNRYPDAFGRRIITALSLLAAALLALFFFSPLAWGIFCLGGLAMAAYEWAFIADLDKWFRRSFFFIIGSFCLAFLVIYFGLPPRVNPLNVHLPLLDVLWIMAAFFWVFYVPLMFFSRRLIQNQLSKWLTGFFILLPAWSALVFLKALSPLILCVVFFSVWIHDSAAYLAGSFWGKHKIAPDVSPGKTWEGSLGAGVLLCLYWAAWFVFYEIRHAFALGLLAALATAYFGLIGDLLESLLKRQKGCKDSGQLFPGHGGMLDRMDAATAILPMAALILCFFGPIS